MRTSGRKRLHGLGLDGVGGTGHGHRGAEVVAQCARTGDLGVMSDRAGLDQGVRTADSAVGAVF
jgi:hypothetical protein